MGEVYQARDTRLGRIVAIKVLADGVGADRQFRERFDREARAISQLTHPHICTLYDVGDEGGVAFLVLEHLEGVTLASRLAAGALPTDQAFTIAIEVVSALDRAHRAGIVHRDLKPGNIMLTRAGAKLLDFGLAKNRAPIVGAEHQSMMPTTQASLTGVGTILGTLQYMAPEQLEGQEADSRTDLFAFGAVLYEMFSGRKAFEGKTSASLISAILRDEPPPVSSMRHLSPAPLDRVVSKCLAKDPDRRWQSAHDLHDELAWIASDTAAAPAARATTASPWRERAGWLVAGLVAIVGATLWTIGPRTKPQGVAAADDQQMQLQIATPAASGLAGFAMSPDRRTIAYLDTKNGQNQIWIRPLDSDTPQALDGTQGAERTGPFWAPDGRSIGYFGDGQLKRVDLDGGVVRKLASAPQPRGGSWGTAGTIVFAAGSAGSLNAVPEQGGDAAVVTRVQRPQQTGHRFPHFLPDGRHFLFYALGGPAGRGLYLGSLDSTEAVRLVEADSSGVFAAPDLVLFAREGALWAQRLDLRTWRPVDLPVPVSKQIAVSSEIFGLVALSETAQSLIAFRPSAANRAFMWFDRSGRQIGRLGDLDSGEPAEPQLSLDGRTIVFRRTIRGNTDLWEMEVGRQIPRRLTSDAAREYEAVRSADGSRLVFNSDRNGVLDLYEKSLSAGDASPERVILETSDHKNVNDWSADDRYLLYSTQSPTSAADLFALPRFGDGTPIPIARTAATEFRGRFSPDGRWVAYESNESGRSEVYVQSFPPPARKMPISTAGGMAPMWRGDGRELFFRSLDGRLMAAAILITGPDLAAEAPLELFTLPAGPSRDGGNTTPYAVSRDGQRFLINMLVGDVPPITVLLNWKPRN
jgi:Tol biopolymer transport system component